MRIASHQNIYMLLCTVDYMSFYFRENLVFMDGVTATRKSICVHYVLVTEKLNPLFVTSKQQQCYFLLKFSQVIKERLHRKELLHERQIENGRNTFGKQAHACKYWESTLEHPKAKVLKFTHTFFLDSNRKVLGYTDKQFFLT